MSTQLNLKKKTIGDLLLYRHEKSKHDKAIGWIEDDSLKFVNYDQYKFYIESLALAFKKQGIKRQDKVCILASTCKEWNFFDMALLSMGVAVVPIYHTYTASEAAFIMNHSEAQTIIVDSAEQMKKVLEVIQDCKNLKHIISIETLDLKLIESVPKSIHYFDYLDFFNSGKEEVAQNPDLFERLIEETPENDIASIIYTSGTTGDPKGAVIKQVALTQMLLNVRKFTNNAFRAEDRTLTFLPLSHVFGRCDSLLPLIFGWQCVYARSIDTLIEDMKLVKPTAMLAVPRIFEKIYSKINKQINDGLKIKQELFNFAIDAAKEYYECLDNDRTPSTSQLLKYQLSYKLIFSKIYETFGGQIRYFISGGAPLSPKIINFLRYCKLTILEGYGLTETIAPCTLNPFVRQNAGTVGMPIGDVKISFASDKEILVKSEALFSGYYKNEEETKRVFTEDGWFRTGDVGEFTEDGYLKITDRKKDLIITSGGKNIAPQKLENQIKLSPYVAQCTVIGDQKKYLTAFIGIDKESFNNVIEKNNLDPDLSVKDLSQLDLVKDLIQEHIDKINAGLASFETIKKFTILPIELSIDNYMTPSLKVKKKLLLEDYKDLIDAMYN
tara:strand:+ start:58609 stop:60441 length:1833 start_codon:yes stop_codon:yes gene_type:complete